MPRSPIGIGMIVGATLGFTLGMGAGLVFGWGPAVEFTAFSIGILMTLGLIVGAMVGATCQLVIYFSTPGKAPLNGPEADYHDLPPRPDPRRPGQGA